MNFREWLSEAWVNQFQTAQGSVYYVDQQGRTQRIKSQHDFHDPKDVGQKPLSQATVYIDKNDATRIGMHGQIANRKVALYFNNQMIYLLAWNDQENRWGMNQTDRQSPIRMSKQPKLGLAPLELWQMRQNGQNEPVGTYAFNWHPGNEITKF